MHFKAIGKIRLPKLKYVVKILLIIKLYGSSTFVVNMHTNEGVSGSTITLARKDALLESILEEIKKQSGCHLIFNKECFRKAHRVTLNVEDAPLEAVLDLCFKDQPYTYAIIGQTILIMAKEENYHEIE